MHLKYCAVLFCLLCLLATGQNPPTSGGVQSTTADSSAQSGASPIGLAAPHYQAEFVPMEYRYVSWDKGYLLVRGPGEAPIILYDKTGKWLFETPVTIEGATRVYINDASPTLSGTAVISVSAVKADGATADLILEVGKQGILRAIRTSPFYAYRVCATDDGTVWAYGQEITEDRAGEPRIHYPMLREYNFEKGQLRFGVDRATVRPPAGVPASGAMRTDVQLKCSSGKVALLNIPINEFMEFDLSASKLSRWPMVVLPEGFHVTGAALTDNGKMYVSALQAGRPHGLTGMFRLDETPSATVKWVTLVVAPPPLHDSGFHLLGSDHQDLVYSHGLRSATFFWSTAPQEEASK